MQLIKLLDQLARRHSYSTAYGDFLRYMRLMLTNPTPHDQIHTLASRYTIEDHQIINDMVRAAIIEHDQQVTRNGWADVFGDLYMEITGKHKSSAMGQFFTPTEVCELVSKLTPPDPEVMAKPVFSVQDPAAGSGRTLLAFHALYMVPQIEARQRTNSSVYYSAIDLDPMCADMCAINMAMHGICGEVLWADALLIDKIYGVWRINPNLLATKGMPHIVEVPEAEWLSYRVAQVAAMPDGDMAKVANPPTKPAQPTQPTQPGLQLTIW